MRDCEPLSVATLFLNLSLLQLVLLNFGAGCYSHKETGYFFTFKAH